jgi:hypothetical protein
MNESLGLTVQWLTHIWVSIIRNHKLKAIDRITKAIGDVHHDRGEFGQSLCLRETGRLRFGRCDCRNVLDIKCVNNYVLQLIRTIVEEII